MRHVDVDPDYILPFFFFFNCLPSPSHKSVRSRLQSETSAPNRCFTSVQLSTLHISNMLACKPEPVYRLGFGARHADPRLGRAVVIAGDADAA